MLLYYVFFLVNITTSFLYNLSSERLKYIINRVYIFLFIIIFGFRNEVGVDWVNYVEQIDDVKNNDLEIYNLEVSSLLLNKISILLNLDIHFFILATTFILILSLIIGLERLKINPYVYLSIAGPFVIVIASLDLIQQGISIAIFILALSYLQQSQLIKFSLLICLATTFHTSVLLAMPLVFIRQSFKRIALFAGPIILLLIVTYTDDLMHYFKKEMYNSGVVLRLSMVIAPAFFIYIIKKKLTVDFTLNRLVNISLISTCILPLCTIISTTVADRLSYYLIAFNSIIFLQLYTMAKDNLKENNILAFYSPYLLIALSMFLFTIWHLFGNYSEYFKFNHIFI